MSGRDWKGPAAAAAMALLFGGSFTGTKVALESFTPAQLIFLRFAAASVLFLVVLPFRKTPLPDRRDVAGLFLMALFEPGLYFYAEAEGVKRTLASTAAILISTIPLFVLVLEALWFKTRVRLGEVGLILSSLGGIFLIVTAGGTGQAFGGTLAGNGLVLLAALTASVYTLLAKRLLARMDALTVTFCQSAFASLLYLPFALRDFGRSAPDVSPRSAWALSYLALFCSFLAYWLLNYSLGRMRATFVAAFTNVIPVVGIAVAVLFLRERLYPMQFLGGAVVLSSMTALTVLEPRWRKETATGTPSGG